MFQIHNVRFGLACNSSSSHSLILFEGESLPSDDHGISFDPHQYDDWEDDEFKASMIRMDKRFIKKQLAKPMNFGHDFFTASSEETKKRYAALTLRYALERHLPKNIYDMIVKSWTGVENLDEDSYIDHQSVIDLPLAFNTTVVDEEFFKEFFNYLMQEKLVILGGSDNRENSHPLIDSGKKATLPISKDRFSEFYCRKDPKYGFWTIFNPEDGTKLRMSFGESKKITKSTFPELVDIKINDYCPFNCKFCYQDSTKDKGHAQINSWLLADVFQKMKVFEVAIGGGEPTMHPSFLEILKHFRSAGIVPNFTTKNLKWLRDPQEYIPILEHAGSFAYSADSSTYIKELATLLDYNKIPHSRATIQIVMGTVDQWQFTNVLKACAKEHFRLTLLGFKDVGRGAGYKPQNYDWWLNSIKESTDNPSISIDTALAGQYEKEILAAGIPSYLFHTQEGRFSCYYDAMNNKIGPSSYCKADEMVDWQLDYDQKSLKSFQKIYAKF